jgi:hypothetical protein
VPYRPIRSRNAGSAWALGNLRNLIFVIKKIISSSLCVHIHNTYFMPAYEASLSISGSPSTFASSQPSRPSYFRTLPSSSTFHESKTKLLTTSSIDSGFFYSPDELFPSFFLSTTFRFFFSTLRPGISLPLSTLDHFTSNCMQRNSH